MKNCRLLIFILFAAAQTFAQKDRTITFSGLFESSVSANAGAGEAPPVSYGLEEYANIRMQANIGEKATFFSAVNLLAAAGDYALKISAQESQYVMGIIDSGQNYASLMELERLFFRIKSETINFDAGLMRLPFGFSNVWGSCDFLNPKNPIKPDARPRAVLGGGLSWFPIDDFKLQTFAVSGKDPLDATGGIGGISLDKHWEKASVQTIYSFEHSQNFPSSDSTPWTHRIGMSAKVDLELGFVLDMLYAINKDIKYGEDGLSLSAGFDYSLFNAKLIILAEYLYSGSASSTSITGGGSFMNKNYLYGGLTWRFSDFTNIGLSLISGFDDSSFMPITTFEHQISNGVTLSVMAQIHIDKNLFNDDGNYGELGPQPFGISAGSYFNLQTKIKVKF
jgi:hypothetical protein